MDLSEIPIHQQIEKVSNYDFRRSPGKYFADVRRGKTWWIMMNGKIDAVLGPPDKATVEMVSQHEPWILTRLQVERVAGNQ